MMNPIDFVFRKLRSPKTWSDKCLKSPVSDDPLTSNMVNVQKRSWNQHHSIFSIFIDHRQVNWVPKSLSSIHVKSWDCFLTHWLTMKSILFLIETIERYQFRCNYLRKKEHFLNFLLHFWNVYQILNILKKKWPS